MIPNLSNLIYSWMRYEVLVRVVDGLVDEE
jgi:hypothetical protein